MKLSDRFRLLAKSRFNHAQAAYEAKLTPETALLCDAADAELEPLAARISAVITSLTALNARIDNWEQDQSLQAVVRRLHDQQHEITQWQARHQSQEARIKRLENALPADIRPGTSILCGES